MIKFQLISEKKIMENKVKKDMDLDKDAEAKIVEFIQKAMRSYELWAMSYELWAIRTLFKDLKKSS